jgi:toxin CcdB
MRRHQVYRMAGGRGLVLDLQSDLLEPLSTRVVAPLLPRAEAPKPARGLNPVFLIGEEEYVLVTQFLSAVLLAELGPPIGSLDAHHDEILRARDLLFDGL